MMMSMMPEAAIAAVELPQLGCAGWGMVQTVEMGRQMVRLRRRVASIQRVMRVKIDQTEVGY